MKTKKIILSVCIVSIILAVSLLFFIFSSGNKIKKGEIYLYDVCDGLNDADFNGLAAFPEAPEYSYSDDMIVAEEKTVMVQGKQYTGKIDGSDVFYILSDQIEYTYRGEGFHFNIEAENGKLTEFSLYTEDCDAFIDVEEGKKIAIDFLRDIIDIDNFTLIKNGGSAIPGEHFREYGFRRYIDGMETGEQIWVCIDANGVITDYFSTALGDFEKDTSLKGFKISDAVEAARIKVAELESKQERYKMTLREDSGILAKMNGRTICVFEVERNTAKGSDELFSIAYIID